MHRLPSAHPLIERWLLQALIAGASFSLLVPFAQAHTMSFGWLPLWLIGLPLAAWLGWRGLGRAHAAQVSGGGRGRTRRRGVEPPVCGRRRTWPMARPLRQGPARA